MEAYCSTLTAVASQEAIGPALLAERDERHRRWLAMVRTVRDDVYAL